MSSPEGGDDLVQALIEGIVLALALIAYTTFVVYGTSVYYTVFACPVS